MEIGNLPFGSLSARTIAFKTIASLCGRGNAGSSFGRGARVTSRSARRRARAPASSTPLAGASGSTVQEAAGAGGAGAAVAGGAGAEGAGAGEGRGGEEGAVGGDVGIARDSRSRMRRTCHTQIDIVMNIHVKTFLLDTNVMIEDLIVNFLK